MPKGDSRYPEPKELDERRRIDARHAELEPPPQQEDPPAMSGLVIWLAKRLRVDAYALAKRFPPDTLRRSKYPFAAENRPDGTTVFKQIGIIEGKQLIHAPTTPGSRRDEIRGGIDVRRREDGR